MTNSTSTAFAARLRAALRPFRLRTVPLERLEAAWAACLAEVERAVRDPGDVAFRAAARAARALLRLERAWVGRAAWNARVRRKRAMLSDARWREEVCGQLGGEAALAAWERRAEALSGGVPETRDRAGARTDGKTRDATNGYAAGKTRAGEWEGEFRLPALPRRRGSSRSSNRRVTGANPAKGLGIRGRGQRAIAWRDDRIPVWPNELRGELRGELRRAERRAGRRARVQHGCSHSRPARRYGVSEDGSRLGDAGGSGTRAVGPFQARTVPP